MGKPLKRNKKLTIYFNAQKGVCVYCHSDMTLDLGYSNTATIDHVIPQSVLKMKDKFNEVACCEKCNRQKADKPLYLVIHNLIQNGEYANDR